MCAFNTYRTSQFEPTTFQVLNSLVLLVATIFDSPDTESFHHYQKGPLESAVPKDIHNYYPHFQMWKET